MSTIAFFGQILVLMGSIVLFLIIFSIIWSVIRALLALIVRVALVAIIVVGFFYLVGHVASLNLPNIPLH